MYHFFSLLDSILVIGKKEEPDYLSDGWICRSDGGVCWLVPETGKKPAAEFV